MCPINANSKNSIFSFLDETVEYIKKLNIDRSGKSILKTKRKTGFIGFIINAHNLKEIYSEYVETGRLAELPTRSLNQDPVENFFGRIRSCLGSNDNPTTEQFSGIYRKVVVSRELTSSTLSNCIDRLNILHMSSESQPKKYVKPAVVRVDPTFFINRKRKPDGNLTSIDTISKLLDATQYHPVDDQEFPFDGSKITIAYLAKIIEDKILNDIRSKCQECSKIVRHIFMEQDSVQHVQRRARQSTVDIGQVCNDLLRIHSFKIDFSYAELLRFINESHYSMDLFPEADFDHNHEHKSDLIQLIVEEFVRLRATYIAKKISLNEKKKMLRRKNLKSVHQAGE